MALSFHHNAEHVFMVCVSAGGAGGKGVWGAAGMVYEDEEPDMRDPNYDESSQVSEYSRSGSFIKLRLKSLDSHTKLDFCAFFNCILLIKYLFFFGGALYVFRDMYGSREMTGNEKKGDGK